jgi:hypothetical protein
MKEYIIKPNLQDIISIDFPDADFRVDEEMLLYDEFISLLKNGEKTTTVRYSKGKIRIPGSRVMPLYETNPDDKDYKKLIEDVMVNRLIIKRYDELNEIDGRNDGFSGRDELIVAIEGIYGRILPEELVSIYHISSVIK